MDLHAKELRDRFWKKDELNGSPIGRPYREIEYISEHSIEEGQTIRNKKLNDLLTFATSNCPFFNKMKGFKGLSDFPIMNKSLYIEYYNDIRVNDENIPGQKGPVHIQTTSGSTGTPFAVPQDTIKRQRRIAELKYFGKIVGFETHEKLVHLRAWNKWQQKQPKQIAEENIIPFNISDMSDNKLAELCKIINEEKALCLRGYASSFDLLSQYVKRHPMLFPSLKICIAGSEALQDDVRANVKKYLQCEIISQYANEECGILAQEKIPTRDTENVMYLNHSGYYFEFLKFDSNNPVNYGEPGRIVITDFHNYAFPIIRYDTGDVGVLSPPNKDSHGYPVMEKLYGRRLDICYTTSGKPLHPISIGRVLKHFGSIRQWQFIQKDCKLYELNVVMATDIDPNTYLATAIEDLTSYLGSDAIIQIKKVEEIPVLASGKRKAVVNKWKK